MTNSTPKVAISIRIMSWGTGQPCNFFRHRLGLQTPGNVLLGWGWVRARGDGGSGGGAC